MVLTMYSRNTLPPDSDGDRSKYIYNLPPKYDGVLFSSRQDGRDSAFMEAAEEASTRDRTYYSHTPRQNKKERQDKPERGAKSAYSEPADEGEKTPFSAADEDEIMYDSAPEYESPLCDDCEESLDVNDTSYEKESDEKKEAAASNAEPKSAKRPANFLRTLFKGGIGEDEMLLIAVIILLSGSSDEGLFGNETVLILLLLLLIR